MSNALVSRAEKPTREVTTTTISYGVHPGIGDGAWLPIHRNFGAPFWGTWNALGALLSWRAGWNGYDAAAPNHQAIGHAFVWIEDLYEDTLTTSKRWMTPSVVADAHGNVVFEWWEGQKKLTIYIHPDTVEYVKVWGPDIFSDMEDGEVKGAEDRRMLWNWLTG